MTSGVPVGLLQLDDWWYNANDTAHMCVSDGVGNKTLFPDGITGLYKALHAVDPGVALDVYANHFEPSYPLLFDHPEIETIPSLLYDYPGRLPAASSSLRFYTLLFESWKVAGIRSYEIDFMKDFVYNQTAWYLDPEGARFWLEGSEVTSNQAVVCVASRLF